MSRGTGRWLIRATVATSALGPCTPSGCQRDQGSGKGPSPSSAIRYRSPGLRPFTVAVWVSLMFRRSPTGRPGRWRSPRSVVGAQIRNWTAPSAVQEGPKWGCQGGVGTSGDQSARIRWVSSFGPLVSVDWLRDHLADPGVKVIDLRWYTDGRSGREA